MRKTISRVSWILLWLFSPLYAADTLTPEKWATLCLKSNVIKWMGTSHVLSESIKGLNPEEREKYINEVFNYFHKVKGDYSNGNFKTALRGLEYSLKNALPITTYADVKSKLAIYNTFKGYWGNEENLIQGNIDTEILALYSRLETKKFPAGEITKPFIQFCRSALSSLIPVEPSAGTE